MVRSGALALYLALALLAGATTGCTSTTGGTATDTSAVITSPETSASTTTPTRSAPDVPEPTVSADAARLIGASSIGEAWTSLSQWILTTGYQADLVRTGTPTDTQLATITDQMTPACRESFIAKSRTRTVEDNNSIESVTAIGVNAPDAEPLPGDAAVTDRAISSATAALTTDQRLSFQVDSSAQVHYAPNAAGGQPFHSLFTRSTTYTLVEQDGRWLVDAWQGTYNTSDPVQE